MHKNKSHIFGYLLGLLIFVIGIPALMWLVSCRERPYIPDSALQCGMAVLLAVCGLALSIYSIVYMRIVGKGNPFDAYGHEVAPRTKHLMTDGPYRLCRNPMLVGIYIYDIGILIWLWSVWPLFIALIEVILLTLQVRSEEKRLEQDFGQEYLDYKEQVGRYYPKLKQRIGEYQYKSPSGGGDLDPSIKLIIFDFDGTLGDTRRNIVTTMQMTIKEMQLPYRSEAECASTIGLPLAGCFKAMFPDVQDELIPRCAETYRRIFNENLKNFKPEAFPNVVKTLKTLKEKGFTMTIASSRSHNSLTELTHNMGIADYISYLIGADDVKEAKPQPEPVVRTLTAMQFEASQTLVVGDMAVDILMGANAGTKTCGVTWGNGTRKELEEAGADYIIDKMEKLISLIPQSL